MTQVSSDSIFDSTVAVITAMNGDTILEIEGCSTKPSQEEIDAFHTEMIRTYPLLNITIKVLEGEEMQELLDVVRPHAPITVELKKAN